jgi:predicted DsbA family dithiol-disulfide isomerase
MLIEVFADFSCPWCFIGRRRFARARAMRPHLRAEIVWQPFQLHPELPPEGVDRHAKLRATRVEADRLIPIETMLEETGGKEGIRFDFAAIRRIPNTMAAHRLMRLAARSKREEFLADAIFSAYFESGQDIGDRPTLVRCATAAGLDAAAADGFLKGNDEADSVTTIDAIGRQSGIAGVPCFIFDRRYALSGAQEPVSFLPLFDALLAGDDAMMASSV